MEGLLQWDERILLAINGCHAPWSDALMMVLSNKWIWIPMYLALAGLIYWKRGGGDLLVALLVAIPVILVADQFASGILKPLVARPRPCHEVHLQSVLWNASGRCGGAYGFVSSHAANFFAVWVYVGGLLRREMKWVFWGLLIVAIAVSYSRIYLGVHYPSDVLVGAAVGAVSGLLGIKVFNWAVMRFLGTDRPARNQNA